MQATYAVELLSEGTEGIGYLLKDRVSELDELAASIRTVGERAVVFWRSPPSSTRAEGHS